MNLPQNYDHCTALPQTFSHVFVSNDDQVTFNDMSSMTFLQVINDSNAFYGKVVLDEDFMSTRNVSTSTFYSIMVMPLLQHLSVLVVVILSPCLQ